MNEVPEALENPIFVPYKLVEVVLVPVAFVQVRLDALKDPTIKFVIVPLVAKKLVVVTLAPVAFVNVTPPNVELPVTDNVPVTDALDVVSPPNKVTLDVAKAPRLVTEASVSASTVPLGQPTPFCKQIPCPATVAEANWAKLANKLDEVAVLNEPVPRTERAVVVTFDPVALVNVVP